MSFDLRELNAFLSVVKSGSLGRAAAVLHITQPALSRTIRQLENKLGVPVFERHTTGMILTEYGRALLPHAQTLLHEASIAREEIDALHGLSKGTVRVGAVASVLSAALPQALKRLMSQYPGLDVQITEGVEDILISALLDNQIDLAIAASTLDKTEGISLVADASWQDTNCMVAASQHPIWHARHMSLADLAQYQWVLPPRGTKPREELHQLFAENDLSPPTIKVETRSVIAIRAMVQHANLLSCLPTPIVRNELETNVMQVLPLAQATHTRHFYVFRRQRGSLPTPAAQLLEALRHVTHAARRSILI